MKNLLDQYQINTETIIKRMLLGALVGFIVISMFVFGVKNPNPNWGQYWMLRPLIVVPIIASLSSLIFFSINIFGFPKAWRKILILVLSTIGFMIALWIGIILGLHGTLWN